MLTFTHISDIHMPDMPLFRKRQLLSKRVTGYIFWRRRRRHSHSENALDAVISDMLAQQPDQILCSGDLTNLGSQLEMEWAAKWLSKMAPPEKIMLVPGNHDAYVPGALRRAKQLWKAWMTGDSTQNDFPYAREIKTDAYKGKSGVVIFGLSTAVATRPYNAQGKVGKSQLTRLTKLFDKYPKDKWCQIVMLHHPPMAGLTSVKRSLRDYRNVTSTLEALSPHLIIYGHNHRHQLSKMMGHSHKIPVIGVRSASAKPACTDPEPGGYNIYQISATKQKWQIRCHFKGFADETLSLQDHAKSVEFEFNS